MDVTDDQQALEQEEEADRVFKKEKRFRTFAEEQHRGHCDSPCACCCIEEPSFLVAMLAKWDSDPVDG